MGFYPHLNKLNIFIYRLTEIKRQQ